MSNLEEGATPSLGGSSNLQLHVLIWGTDRHMPASPGSQGPPSDTMCHWTPQVYLPNGMETVERFKQGARM